MLTKRTDFVNVPYLPGNKPPPDFPLGRFLPPIPPGMAKSWCRNNLNPGDWVLEPFGFNPLMAIEISAAGYPVLVCVNNPIHAFLLQVLASAPSQEEFSAALQDMAISSKGEDRMENYIRSLYKVECNKCRRLVEADAFLWKKDENQPYAAQINCPICGTYGDQLLTTDALNSLTPLPPKQLHLARALNRVSEKDDAIRKQVENILNAYPTRPLIILQTIFNKLESLQQTPRRRELLIALILSAADRGNTLWAYPSPRHRPRQVVIPSVYQEKNLWKEMGNAIRTWQVISHAIPVKDWNGPPPNGEEGIYKYNGRIKELQPSLKPGFFSAVVAAIPRPNQAFWSLSALWAGWIWGADAVIPIRQVLSRQRYDWNWHCHALMSVFEAIHQFNQPSLKILGIIAESEPMLLLTSLLAADASGFLLEEFAQSMDDQIAQCSWKRLSQYSQKSMPPISSALTSVVSYLHEKGEPASYQQIHTALITGLAAENNLAISPFFENINQATSETQKWIETTLLEARQIKQINTSHTGVEAGNWWLTDNNSGTNLTLVDRLEVGLYRYLTHSGLTSLLQVQQVANNLLPGIFTPERDLVSNCLSSYVVVVDKQNSLLKLAEFELPEEREADKRKIINSLIQLANKLGFRASGYDPLEWLDTQGTHVLYRFNILTSAIVTPYLISSHPAAKNNILVIPGSRANLLAYKKQRDSILKEKLDRNFYVIKYRLIRDLEINPLLSYELFKEQILTDPPEYEETQLALF